MNIKELSGKTTVDEVAMNPTAYAQSVEQGQTEGVLVGFEFEVCVPKATMTAQADAERGNRSVPPMDKERIARIVNGMSGIGNMITSPAVRSSIWREDWNQPYLRWDRLFEPNGIHSYPTLMDAKTAVQEKQIEKAEALLARLPTDKLADFTRLSKAKIARRIRQGSYSNPSQFTPQDKKMMVIQDIANRYLSDGRDNPATAQTVTELARELIRMDIMPNPSDVFKAMWPSITSFNDILDDLNRYVQFKVEPAEVYDQLNLIGRDPNVPEDERTGRSNGGYYGCTKVLKPAIERTMGADVKVFRSYHQQTKNMTSWYIEPDGSLHPNPGDGAAEVVGPPEAPKSALESLKKFFGMAKELNLYTSKQNNTGLHINVSIPKDLDVLKLAVMLGDENVLKQFGRENNNYARSIMQQLSAPRSSKKVGTTVPSATKTPFGNTENKINLQLLQDIAKDISGDHFTSVNWTGKYISFRHAGGDYLNDYQGIVNVVGRFVRAMVIASDPNAYRNEYLKAVVKLVDRRQPTDTNQRSQYIENIKRNGLIVKTVELYLRKESFENPTEADFALALSEYNQLVPGVNYSITSPSAEAKQILIRKSRAEGRARTEMSNPELQGAQQFAHCVIYPISLDESLRERGDASSYRGVDLLRARGVVVGYRATTVSLIGATDPPAITFMRKLKSTSTRY